MKELILGGMYEEDLFVDPLDKTKEELALLYERFDGMFILDNMSDTVGTYFLFEENTKGILIDNDYDFKEYEKEHGYTLRMSSTDLAKLLLRKPNIAPLLLKHFQDNLLD
jgi:hypothetical protein